LLGLIKNLGRHMCPSRCRPASPAQDVATGAASSPPAVLDSPTRSPAGGSRRHQQLREAELNVRRPPPVAWEAPERRHHHEDRSPRAQPPALPTSDSGRLSSSFASVSIPKYSPRSPLPSPQLNRAPGCLNRRRGKPPEPPYAPVESLKKLLVFCI
jgi:hypothetical protein